MQNITNCCSRPNYKKYETKKGSHVLKGTIGSCEGCKQQFMTSTLIWNANDKRNNLVQHSDSYFSKDDVQFLLSKEKIDTILI